MTLISAHFFFDGNNIIKMINKECFYYIEFNDNNKYSLICNKENQIELANLSFYNGIIILNNNKDFSDTDSLKNYFLIRDNNEKTFLSILKDAKKLFLSSDRFGNYVNFLHIDNIDLTNFKIDKNLTIEILK